jgi:hypothetical protein
VFNMAYGLIQTPEIFPLPSSELADVPHFVFTIILHLFQYSVEFSYLKTF